jgi:hypothetical protein
VIRRAAPLPAALPAAALLALLLAAAGAGAGPRVVAVGDVHGAYDALRDILLATGLIDAGGRWAGGDAVLVQTGDLLDRGADALRVAWWLMRLQEEAPAAGGRVIVLLGNHEVMNLMGDLRYVTPEMVAPLADADSEKRRSAECKERSAILRRAARDLGERPPLAGEVRKACVEEIPPGLIEYVAALRPEEPLGRWLRRLPAVARVGEVVFVHGGLSAEMAAEGVDAINRQVRSELATFDAWRDWLVREEKMVASASLTAMARAVRVEVAIREKAAAEAEEGDEDAVRVEGAAAPDLDRFFEISDSLLLRQDGPLWFRGYHDWTEEEGRAALPGILERLAARHLVVGHTPRKTGRIESRFGHRVFLIDTGMLADYYGGAPAALQFADGRVEAVYLDEQVVLLEAPAEQQMVSEPR